MNQDQPADFGYQKSDGDSPEIRVVNLDISEIVNPQRKDREIGNQGIFHVVHIEAQNFQPDFDTFSKNQNLGSMPVGEILTDKKMHNQGQTKEPNQKEASLELKVKSLVEEKAKYAKKIEELVAKFEEAVSENSKIERARQTLELDFLDSKEAIKRFEELLALKERQIAEMRVEVVNSNAALVSTQNLENQSTLEMIKDLKRQLESERKSRVELEKKLSENQ